jgi:hypothetical protein
MGSAVRSNPLTNPAHSAELGLSVGPCDWLFLSFKPQLPMSEIDPLPSFMDVGFVEAEISI